MCFTYVKKYITFLKTKLNKFFYNPIHKKISDVISQCNKSPVQTIIQLPLKKKIQLFW